MAVRNGTIGCRALVWREVRALREGLNIDVADGTGEFLEHTAICLAGLTGLGGTGGVGGRKGRQRVSTSGCRIITTTPVLRSLVPLAAHVSPQDRGSFSLPFTKPYQASAEGPRMKGVFGGDKNSPILARRPERSPDGCQDHRLQDGGDGKRKLVGLL